MPDRLDEMEIRYTLQEDLVRQLSDVIAAHARRIDALEKELERLRDRATASPPPFDPDEKPPHY